MALDNISTPTDVHSELREELLEGLESRPRYINPKFFYDERGSELFSRICELAEYYPTRTEIDILDRQSEEIAEVVGPGCELVEPGAGNCEKVRYLIDDLEPAAYLPLDISRDFLLDAAERLREDFPGLQVRPLVADFSEEFELPESEARRVLFYPGSTIGNFEPEAAAAFLRRAAAMVGRGGGMLIGVDLHKDSEVLNAAYNDSQGITAEFNRNILRHANELLGADFDPDQFEHVAFYNERQQRVEMHLESRAPQQVQCRGKLLEFEAGERIHTEYSHKYTVDGFGDLASAAGFEARSCWTDDAHLFSVQYFEATA